MNELCSQIELYLVSDVEKVSGTTVVLKEGRKLFSLQADEFSLTPKPQNSDAGTVYYTEETIPVEKVPGATQALFHTPRSVIVRLKTTDNYAILGTMDFPAKVSITQQLNKSQLHLTAKTPNSPF